MEEHPSLSKSIELLQKGFAVQVAADRKLTYELIPSAPKDFHLTLDTVAKLHSNQWIELLDQLQVPKGLALSILNLSKGENGKKIILKSQGSPYQAVWKNEKGWLFEYTNEKNIPAPSFKVAIKETLPKVFCKKEIYLNPEKIAGELSVRKWKTGDRLYPIGMNGSKLVSDILKDAKTPTHERKNVWVLEDEEKIISLVNYCIDARCIAKKAPCVRIEFK